MKLNKCLMILVALAILCLGLPLMAQAGCTKFCRILPTAHLTFMMVPTRTSNDTDQRKGYTLLEEFKAEGYYGGGCNTSVGRQKARKRACTNAKDLARKAYEGKPNEWQNYLCSKKAASTNKYSLLYFRGSGGKIHITPLDEVKWLKVERIELKVLAEDGTTGSVRRKGEYTIKSSGEKFACKDGKPVPVQ